MATKWTTITVSPEVLAWISRERAYLLELHTRGLVEVDLTERSGRQQGNGISADQVLRRLIARVDGHRRRSKKAEANRRRLRRRETQPGASVPPAAPPAGLAVDPSTQTVSGNPA